MKKLLLILLAFGNLTVFAASTQYYFGGCKSYDQSLLGIHIASGGFWGNRSLGEIVNVKSVYKHPLIEDRHHVTLFQKGLSTTINNYQNRKIMTEYRVYTTSDEDPNFEIFSLLIFWPTVAPAAGQKTIFGLEAILLDKKTGPEKVVAKLSGCVLSEDSFSQGTWEE